MNHFKKNPYTILWKTNCIFFMLLFYHPTLAQSDKARKVWVESIEKGIASLKKGDIKAATKDFEESNDRYKEYDDAVRLEKKRLTKEDHEVSGRMEHEWGLACVKAGDQQVAAAHFRKAITIRKYYLGEDNPDTKASEHELAKLQSQSEASWKINFTKAQNNYAIGQRYSEELSMATNGLKGLIYKNFPEIKRLTWDADISKALITRKTDSSFKDLMIDWARLSIFSTETDIREPGSVNDPKKINTAVQIFKTFGDSVECARAIVTRGNFQFFNHKYDKAESDYLKAITMFRSMDSVNHQACVQSGVQLSKIYIQRDQYADGENILLKGKAQLTSDKWRVRNYIEYVNALYNFYTGFGNYRSAELLLEECENEFKTKKDNESIYYAYYRALKGSYDLTMGNYDGAIENSVKAVELYDKYKIFHTLIPIAVLYGNLHNAYFATGQTQLAQAYQFKLAFTLGDDPSSRLQQKFRNQQEQLYTLRLGTYSKVPASTSYPMDILREMGVPKPSEKYKDFMRKHPQELPLSYFYKSMNGVILMLKDCLHDIQDDFKGQHPLKASVLNELGVAYLELDSLEESFRYLREALEVAENDMDARSTHLSLKDKEVLLKLNHQIVANNESLYLSRMMKDPTAAPKVMGTWYDLKLKFKGMMASNERIILERVSNSNDASLSKLYSDWRSLNDSIAGLAKVKDFPSSSRQLLEESSLLKEREIMKRLELSGTLADAPKTSWKDVQMKLKASEAAMEITKIEWITDTTKTMSAEERANEKRNPRIKKTAYVALLIKPGADAPMSIMIDQSEKLEKAASNFKTMITADLHTDDLYNWFWSPLSTRLNGYKKLFLSPDGVYSQINLNILKNPVNGMYVIDEFDIELVGNTKEIRAHGQVNGTKQKKAALYGNPDFKGKGTPSKTSEPTRGAPVFVLTTTDRGVSRFFDKGEIDPLPGSGVEVEKIGQLLKDGKFLYSTFEGTKATEEEIKRMSGDQVLHIATHGFFLSDRSISASATTAGLQAKELYANPLLRSGLLLAGAQRVFAKGGTAHITGEDGVLTAQEVLGLHLSDAKLIVLSACETGLGLVVSGEGVYGLQRSFQIAGAKTILMSLWSVDDNSTQELMTLFYGQWLNGKTAAEAFKTAQITLRKKYPNPNNWGPFVMVGDGSVTW